MRLNPEVPAQLEEIINKALEKDRNLRYQHASEIRTDLQRLKRDTESTSAVAVPASPDIVRPNVARSGPFLAGRHRCPRIGGVAVWYLRIGRSGPDRFPRRASFRQRDRR